MESGSLYHVSSFVRGLQRMSCSFVIAGVSKRIGNMQQGNGNAWWLIEG